MQVCTCALGVYWYKMKTRGIFIGGGKRMGSTKKDKETHPEDDAVEMMGER